MTEQWIASPDAYGYEVSSLGQVRRMLPDGHRAKPGFVLKTHYDESGYAYVRPCVAGRARNLRINRAVCRAFHGEPFERAEAAHNNGDCKDNRPENLRWATAAENAADRVRHGTAPRGERNVQSKLTEDQVYDIRSRPNYLGVCRDLSVEFGVSRSLISGIRRGKKWPVATPENPTAAEGPALEDRGDRFTGEEGGE